MYSIILKFFHEFYDKTGSCQQNIPLFQSIGKYFKHLIPINFIESDDSESFEIFCIFPSTCQLNDSIIPQVSYRIEQSCRCFFFFLLLKEEGRGVIFINFQSRKLVKRGGVTVRRFQGLLRYPPLVKNLHMIFKQKVDCQNNSTCPKKYDFGRVMKRFI